MPVEDTPLIGTEGRHRMQTAIEHSAGDEATLFLAGHTAPAGTYLRVGTDREVRLDQEDILPATCDGQVATYIRRPTTWAETDTV